MRLLLDTCAFLWIAADDPSLSSRARELFADPANDVFLSAASAWEIAVKFGLGKLPLPEPPREFVPRVRTAHGIESLTITEAATLTLARLPALHRDPFDRLLVCQAISEGLTILTPDAKITAYPAPCVW